MQPTASPALLPAAATSLAASQILQSVLRRPTSVNTPIGTDDCPSLAVHQAIVALISILQTLASADSGWPADKSRTPATLLPYVSDEVAELLEALHQNQPHDVSDSTSLPSSDTEEDLPLELVADLGAYLVWCLAASSPETMQLLEGMSVPVACLTPAETSQSLRLVPVLTLQVGNQHCELDLVTQTLFESDTALPDDGQRAHSTADADIPALSLAAWRHQLWARAIAHTPNLQEWATEQPLTVLLPGQDWCEAQISLSLYFVPFETDPWTAPFADKNAVIEAPSLGLDTAQWPPLSLDTQLTFMDRDWYCEAIAAPLSTAIRTQLETHQSSDTTAQALAMLQPVHRVLSEDLMAPDRLPILPSTLSLTQLCTYIQWLWIRADQTLMAWMSGVPASYLQLGDDWQSGTLVATSQLEFSQDGDIVGCLEVGMGHWQTEHPSAPPDGILQLQKPLTHHSQTLWSLAALQTYLENCLHQRSPLLARLMAGTAVQSAPPDDASVPLSWDACWQMRFQVTLTFYPFV